MREKRKDNKGRVLKDGEQQRQDGRYVYRYTAPDGKRKSLYAGTLQELRAKEEAALQNLRDGLDYQVGSMTVATLVDRYLAQKQDVRVNTKYGHNFVKNLATKRFSPKNLQCLMGHADIHTTLNIYAHSNYDEAEKEFFEWVANQ